MNASEIADMIPPAARDVSGKRANLRLRDLYRMLLSYNWGARELAMMEAEVKGEVEQWENGEKITEASCPTTK